MHLFCQVSNALGLFPVIFLFQNGMYWPSALLFLSFFLSTVYHMDETSFTALLFDVSGVTVLLSCLMYLSMNSAFLFTPMNVFAVVMLIAALVSFVSAGDDTQSERYSVYHAAWHVFSVYGISAFVYSFVHTGSGAASVLSRPVYPMVKHLVPCVVKDGVGVIHTRIRRYVP